jgi:hypothetical protein
MANRCFLGVAADLVVIDSSKAGLLASTEDRLRALIAMFLRSTLNVGIVWDRQDLHQFLEVVKSKASATMLHQLQRQILS